jgi:hypothetical protein
MHRMARLAIAIVVLLSLATPVQAAGIDDCRISASPNQTVSLGFPIKTERLAAAAKSKILVIPFKLKDNPTYVFSDALKADYLTAAQNISKLSNGLASVEFVFAPTISTELTNADMDQLKINQREYWQRDENKSTWGFVRKFIADNDPQLDYTGINGVIIEGSSTSQFSDIAEAFMFSQNPQNPWFRPIQTKEGLILNAVLLDNDSSHETITHEVMHLYGLTDLYGTDTGPGRLSLMASNELNLLSYEKWVLGWLPNNDVTCISSLPNKSITSFTFDNSKVDQLAVIRAPNEDAYIVETTRSGGRKFVAFYTLNNEQRPPITLYQERTRAQSGGVEIEDYRSIGVLLKAPKYTLLVTNIEASKISFSLIPTSLVDSSEYKELIAKAAQNRTLVEQQNNAAAELKAKQEAEAKAAAELKAKQEAEAKAAAELKAKQDAAAKAAAVKKKTTITCVKGKTVKRVSAVSPKCPSGFKRR